MDEVVTCDKTHNLVPKDFRQRGGFLPFWDKSVAKEKHRRSLRVWWFL